MQTKAKPLFSYFFQSYSSAPIYTCLKFTIMKKTILILIGTLLIGSTAFSVTVTSNVNTTVNLMPGGTKKFTKTDKKGIAVIKKFYSIYYKKWQEEMEWSDLNKIMTSKCINKLLDLYEYEGNGIAMWAFWMLNTDAGEDAGKFVSRTIVPSGNGWFRVTNKHKNRSEVLRVKVIETDNGWKIDDVVNDMLMSE